MIRKLFNFLKSSIIVVNGLLIPFYSTICAAILWITNFKKIKTVSYTDIVVLSFLVLYPLVNYLIGIYSLFASTKTLILLLSVFLFAKNLRFDSKTERNKFFLYFLGYLGFVLILFITNDSSQIIQQRGFISPFSGVEMNSPAITLLASFSFILIPFINNKDKILSISIISLIILVLYLISLTGVRTPYFILAIIAFYDLITRVRVKNIGYIVTIYLSIVSLIYYYLYLPYTQYFLTISRFKEAGLESRRFEMFSHFFDIFHENFLGSKESIANAFGYSYFHNVFMDIFDMSGIIPLVFILAIFILYVKNCIYLLIRDRSTFPNILISLFIVIMIYYNLEPIPYFGIHWMAILIFSVVSTSNYVKQNIK